MAQLICKPSGSDGTGYPSILQAGLGIESPDCKHSDFGAHVTQAFDEQLQRNIFLFHSHILEDTDRCEVEDRIRMEIKGGPNTSTVAQHPLGSTSYYRWKFKIPKDFQGSSSFCHIFQNKIYGGEDSGFPVITITLRSNSLEIIHNGGDSGADLGRLSSLDLDAFRGRWVEAYIKQTHAENGLFEVSLKDIATKKTLIEYSNDHIDLWRLGGEYSRPKWGIYRLRAPNLKDEVIQFADFCLSETEENLCPADSIVIIDTIPPTQPQNLSASNIMINSADLAWNPSTDNIGVTNYLVYQDGNQVWQGNETTTTISLTGSTTYIIKVAATDAAGNQSLFSDSISITTDDSTSIPGVPTSPNPADEAINQIFPLSLSWTPGENTDSFNIYFGESENITLVATQVESTYELDNLETNKKYYWQIGSLNSNGERRSALWTFTTGETNIDDPWKVYRSNARLDIESNFWAPLDIPGEPDVDELVADPNGSDNQYYKYYESGEEKFRWSYDFGDQDTAVTVIGRIKALNADIDCICYFEVKGFGFREKVRINQRTIKLERSSPVVEINWPVDILKQFHVFRMTMKGNQAIIYIDEDPEPFAIGKSTTSNSDYRFEWGKSGSNACGGMVDWIAVLENRVSVPGEDPPLPEDLFLSSDATLSMIELGGAPLDNFHPDTFHYQVPVGDMVPSIIAVPTSSFSEIIISNPVFVPNTSAIIEVRAQDGFTSATYVIEYVSATSSDDKFFENSLQIFPNLTRGIFRIESEKPLAGMVNVYDLLGRNIHSQNFNKYMQIDLSAFQEGLYLVEVVSEDGYRALKKIFKK